MTAAAENQPVEIRDLNFAYDRRRKILNGVSVTVRRRQVVAVMGGSGSGKTTLLRAICGQNRADSGSVVVGGESICDLTRAGLYRLRRRIGMLFQFGGLFTDMSVFDNVAFPLREHTRLPPSVIHDLVLLKLQAVGLRSAAMLYPSEVSGGMARRIALARTLALDPDIILYDEPFAGLDPVSLSVIAKLIRRQNDALGASSVIVTHDVDESFSIADYVYVMWEGRIVSEGTPDEMRESTHPIVHQFINGKEDGPLPFHRPGVPLERDLRLRAEAATQ